MMPVKRFNPRLEERVEIAARHGLKEEALTCGYLRQPFFVEERKEYCHVQGHCSLYDQRCDQRVDDGSSGWRVESCRLYQLRYGKVYIQHYSSE